MTGLPRFTIARGHVAVTENEIDTIEGHGRFVARDSYPAVSKALSKWRELTDPQPVKRDPSKMPVGV